MTGEHELPAVLILPARRPLAVYFALRPLRSRNSQARFMGIPSSPFHPSAWRRAGCIVVLGAVTLTGCVQVPTLEGIKAAVFKSEESGSESDIEVTRLPAAGAGEALLAFIASARDNESTRIVDAAGAGEVRLIAGRRYHAASGRLCRRFRIASPPESSTTSPGLACRNGTGRWYRVQPIANASD